MQFMNAEVVSIGDEITSGQRLDTNSQWLSQRLEELGIRVDFHTTVGDVLESNVQVFRQAISRADVVIATGGLGPTADDLTREALSRVTGKPLQLDDAVLASIRALFSRRRRNMPERNIVQAMFPETSQPIPNPHGTAPGIHMRVNRDGGTAGHVFALPGVPAEMREMWGQSVSADLLQLQGSRRQVVCHHCVKCFGVGESDLEQMLPDLIRRGRIPTVGITASKATLTLRLTAAAESIEAGDILFAPTLAEIRDKLGDLVFSERDDEELQHALLHQLRERGQTLASVEVGSQGLLSAWLTEADQSGTAYRGGFNVPQAVLAADDFWRGHFPHEGDWSRSVQAYAGTVRELLRADYGLAIGPFPQSDSALQAPGDVHIGLATTQQAHSLAFPFAGHPELLRERTVKLALNALRLLVRDEK
jgi:nicotinamide-nucleotide amidase